MYDEIIELMEDALKKGNIEGKIERKIEGKIEGRIDAQKATSLRMLRKKTYSLEEIADICDLNLETVAKLQQALEMQAMYIDFAEISNMF